MRPWRISDITQPQLVNGDDWQALFSIRASMQDITLQVILRTVFGLDEGERFQQLKQLLNAGITPRPYTPVCFFFPTLQRI